MARVAVVLPVYNHERYLQQALDSIYCQDYTDYQIVAVNDGSSDSSLKILNENHARITLIEAGHRGAAAARNTAIRAVDCEFVAFMDADDVWTPERLRESLERFQSSRVDLIASALSFIDGNGRALPGIWACPPEGNNDYWGALLERNWTELHRLPSAGRFWTRWAALIRHSHMRKITTCGFGSARTMQSNTFTLLWSGAGGTLQIQA